MGIKQAAKLKRGDKVKQMLIVVWPRVGYRVSAWPLTKTLLKQIRGMQLSMVATFNSAPPISGESADEYCRRRHRAASACCAGKQAWDRLACERVLSWEQHIRRGHVPGWASALVGWHDSNWLQTCRYLAGSSSVMAGRTRTRSGAGRAAQRWDEGVLVARDFLRL